jgi:predicted 2-oxoglutarate/Fe(II)-dependent dioxygenase YbiX/peroxiredoxin
MSQKCSTYDLAANQIAAYVQPLVTGAFALPFELRDENGRLLKLTDDHLSGSNLLLLFLNDLNLERFTSLLTNLARRQAQFEDNKLSVVVITASSDAQANRQLKRRLNIDWPILGDSTGAIFASYGLHKRHGESSRLVLLTPLRQVRVWFDSATKIENALEEIMNKTTLNQGQQPDRWSQPHAPILLIPNVLSPEECCRLTDYFELGAPFTVRPPRQGEFDSDYQMPVYEHNRQDRVDQIIKDRNILEFLDQRIWGRVTPMIKKAFAFDVTLREDLHIARYQGNRDGNQMGHRDDSSVATAYRRFAFSMNLNNNFEGGELVFNEYNPCGYKTTPGTAMVFSSSLLHEVNETTKGVRYNLISHFYNESTINKR